MASEVDSPTASFLEEQTATEFRHFDRACSASVVAGDAAVAVAVDDAAVLVVDLEAVAAVAAVAVELVGRVELLVAPKLPP